MHTRADALIIMHAKVKQNEKTFPCFLYLHHFHVINKQNMQIERRKTPFTKRGQLKLLPSDAEGFETGAISYFANMTSPKSDFAT